MPEALFNSQQFLQSLAGDKELAEELLAAFMEDSPIRSHSLDNAIDAGDTEAVSRLAHSLKGMCGVVRADALVNLALSMERTAENGDLTKAKGLHATFTDKLAEIHAEMTAYLGE